MSNRALMIARAAALPPTIVGTSAVGVTTASLPVVAGIAAGDIGVIFDSALSTGATPPANPADPTGWTRRGTTQTAAGGGFAGRLNIFSKVLTASEAAAVCMVGNQTGAKWMLVFRLPAGATAWGTPSSINHQIALTTLANQTITQSGGKGIAVGLGDLYNVVTPGTFVLTPGPGTYADFGSTRVGAQLFARAAVNQTASNNTTAGGALASLWIPYS